MNNAEIHFNAEKYISMAKHDLFPQRRKEKA